LEKLFRALTRDWWFPERCSVQELWALSPVWTEPELFLASVQWGWSLESCLGPVLSQQHQASELQSLE
jgi:hypothetical protein